MGLVVAAPAQALGSPASQFPRVPSLLFELEIDDALKGAGADGVDDTIVEEIARFLRPSSVAEARLVSDVDDALEDGCTDTSMLAQRLTTLGYRVCLRTALGGGDGSDCLRNLRHNFLTCTLPGLGGQHTSAALQQQQRRYVVDPMFRDQFVIAKPTVRYAAILGTIPEAYVGPEEHLGPLVDFLCYEISAAFKQNGVVLPPWRHASSMISKWRPRRSLDEQVAPLGLLGTSYGVVAAPGGWASAVEHLRDHLPAPQGRTQQQHPPQRSSMDVPRRPAPMMLVPRKVVFGGDFAAVPAA